MQHFDYKPHGVCPMNISFDLDGDTVHNVSFKGGCNGNLQAISRVVEGMTVEQIEGYFKGISCNGRGTSCSDQLATAVLSVCRKSRIVSIFSAFRAAARMK